MQRKHLFIVTITFLLASCRAGRDYQRPEVPLPEQFEANAGADTTSIGDMEWKQFFTDATLQSLIDKAVRDNFNLQLAMQRAEEARIYVKQARVNWTPVIVAQGTASTTIPSKNSLNGISLENFLGTSHVEDYTLGATLSWELDIWGRLRRQREAAVADFLESFEAARAVKTTLVADIANTYFNLLMLDAQLDVARKNLLLGDTVVNMMQLQKQAGQVTELAVQQAIAQREAAAQLVPQLEQEIAVQENTLRILTGELPGTINRNSLLNDFVVPAQLPTGIPASMVSRRPDVRASEMALKSANARVGVAQGSMYPVLSISATSGLNSFKSSNWFTMPASLFGTVAGNLAQPVLNQRRLQTQLEVARVQREQAVIRFRQSVLNAVGEVSNALVRLEKLDSQQRIAAERVQTLQQAVHNAGMLFRSGLADYLEVITAQSNALQAELVLADIRRQRLSAMVELYRALGGGWKE
jgi:efflux transporter, outer membrane factor (OMF) lipoprotein, NodT family